MYFPPIGVSWEINPLHYAELSNFTLPKKAEVAIALMRGQHNWEMSESTATIWRVRSYTDSNSRGQEGGSAYWLAEMRCDT